MSFSLRKKEVGTQAVALLSSSAHFHSPFQPLQASVLFLQHAWALPFFPHSYALGLARSWGSGLPGAGVHDCSSPFGRTSFSPLGRRRSANMCTDSAILSSALVYSAPFKSCFDKFTFSLLSSFAWRAERALSNRPPPKSP